MGGWVKIINNTIRGFNYGIEYYGGWLGILGNGGNNILIMNNNIDTGAVWGISIDGCINVSMIDNYVSNYDYGYGVRITGSHNVILKNNQVTSNN